MGGSIRERRRSGGCGRRRLPRLCWSSWRTPGLDAGRPLWQRQGPRRRRAGRRGGKGRAGSALGCISLCPFLCSFPLSQSLFLCSAVTGKQQIGQHDPARLDGLRSCIGKPTTSSGGGPAAAMALRAAYSRIANTRKHTLSEGQDKINELSAVVREVSETVGSHGMTRKAKL